MKSESFVVPGPFLDGHMLVALPTLVDSPYERAIVYICSHTEEGAMGLVLNRPAVTMKIRDVFVQLGIIDEEDEIDFPPCIDDERILSGGPAEAERGFVLHSPDFHIADETVAITPFVSLTASLTVLRAIKDNAGPQSAVLLFGYAGWEPGQLEKEVGGPGWLVCPFDASLIFGENLKAKYVRALALAGVDIASMSSHHGHA